VEVRRPDIRHSRLAVDFGPGFYVTPLIEQARSWCDRQLRRHGSAVLNAYELEDAAWSSGNVLTFDSYSDAWLDFVSTCRAGNDVSDYDIVMGGVANDRIFDTLELYFEGMIDSQSALQRLRYEKPNLQICLRSQDIIALHLPFLRSEPL